MEVKNNEEVVYFEVNNWFSGRDFPDCEPFLTWMRYKCNAFGDRE